VNLLKSLRQKIGTSEPFLKLNPRSTEPLPILIKNHWPTLLFLFLLCLVTYTNTFNNEFVSDDIRRYQRFLTGGAATGFDTLSDLSLRLNFILSRDNPLSYHVGNLFFHCLTTGAVFFAIYILTNFQLAFITAGIFAVHPLNSEAVTWISGRPYPFSTGHLISVTGGPGSVGAVR